jgi:hypothetical protein
MEKNRPKRKGPKHRSEEISEMLQQPRKIVLMEPGDATRRKLVDGSALAHQRDEILRAGRKGSVKPGTVGAQLQHRRASGIQASFDDDQIHVRQEDSLRGKIQVPRGHEQAIPAVEGQPSHRTFISELQAGFR